MSFPKKKKKKTFLDAWLVKEGGKEKQDDSSSSFFKDMFCTQRNLRTACLTTYLLDYKQHEKVFDNTNRRSEEQEEGCEPSNKRHPIMTQQFLFFVMQSVNINSFSEPDVNSQTVESEHNITSPNSSVTDTESYEET